MLCPGFTNILGPPMVAGCVSMALELFIFNIRKMHFKNVKKILKYIYMWAMIYTLTMHSTNPKYIVVYFTQKRQNQRSRFVNSTPLNLVIFFLFCVAHNTMYLRLRFCILVIYIISYMNIFFQKKLELQNIISKF
jgi:hypothetical protein